MRFPPSFLDDIRARIPIADVGGGGLLLIAKNPMPPRVIFGPIALFMVRRHRAFIARMPKGATNVLAVVCREITFGS